MYLHCCSLMKWYFALLDIEMQQLCLFQLEILGDQSEFKLIVKSHNIVILNNDRLYRQTDHGVTRPFIKVKGERKQIHHGYRECNTCLATCKPSYVNMPSSLLTPPKLVRYMMKLSGTSLRPVLIGTINLH